MYVILKTMLFGVLFVSSLTHAENQWRKKIDRKGIKVYQQHQHPKYKQWHTKGVMTVQGSAASVLALLRDLSVCSQWVHGCISAERTHQELIHMVFKGPLWFRDRDVVFSAAAEEQADTGSWQILITNRPHQLPAHDHLRVQNMEASWQIIPVNDQQIDIIYQYYMDPEIGFKSGVNKYNRDAMYLTLKQMRLMLQKEAYKQAQ